MFVNISEKIQINLIEKKYFILEFMQDINLKSIFQTNEISQKEEGYIELKSMVNHELCFLKMSNLNQTSIRMKDFKPSTNFFYSKETFNC
jgi:hypothetical protein